MNKLIVMIIVLVSFSCSSKRKTIVMPEKVIYKQKPGVIIYKTKVDYFNKVPVLLSDDKTQLISYPAPKDLVLNDSTLRIPVRLEDNYLLDVKGIWTNVGFLKFTYKEFSTFTKSPLPSEIKNAIIDNDPLIEFYHDMDNSMDSLPENQLIEYLNSLILNNDIEKDMVKLK